MDHPSPGLLTGLLAAAIAVAGPISVAHAQASGGAPVSSGDRAPRARVVVFRVAPSEPGLQQLARALEPLLIAEISQRSKVVAQHALDLASTQLALDCMAETPDCLRAAMHQPGTDAQILVAPTLGRSKAELVLSLLYFSTRHGDALRHATRRAEGARAQSAILDSVPSAIEELFATADRPPERTRAQPVRTPRRELEREQVDRDSLPVVPIVLTTAGVAILSTGVAFGLSARATEKEYAAAVTGTDAEADEAAETFERAQTQATLASVGIAAGAAAITAGVGLWLFDSDGDAEQPSARLIPRLTRGGAGVVFEGRFVEPQP